MNEPNILVVEDEAIVAMEIEELLASAGFNPVGWAPSGGEALALAEQQDPDLVLMDICLKGETDGIDTAKEIRRRHNIPVIFLTAHSERETLTRAKSAEPFGYILKPFSSQQLKSAIEIAIHKHRTLEESHRISMAELEKKSDRLKEADSAMRALIRQMSEDRKELEEAIATNIDNLILPYLRRLKISPLSSTQAVLIEVLEAEIKEITSSFARRLSMEFRHLTPTEIRVAALVREGKSTKEIADLMCISQKTASFHRDNIRIKLGLRGKKVNLRSHLLCFS